MTREKTGGSHSEAHRASTVGHSSTWKAAPSPGVNSHPKYGRQPTRQVCLHVRFTPIYSMNDLQVKNPFLLKNIRYVENAKLMYQNHILLRPIRSDDAMDTKSQWQVCTRLVEQAQLALVDRTDKGQRRAAVRLINYLFQISDLCWKTKLLQWVEPKHLYNIVLYATSDETDVSNRNVLAYLSDGGSKTIVWQRTPLMLIVQRLLEYVYHAMQHLRLPTFNGIVTNMLSPPQGERERKELSKIRSVLGGWVKSEAALRQVLEMAIKRMTKNPNTISHHSFTTS
ncbi:unnamed protein product [Echinostoma caproni]|uniref:CID domain-containing protein n=1 Tax=Echinostoma caproni TaxID=27848 RepID=A0A183B0Z3_9TREM|nr:unnamed protein product [Echinostoma caproni]